MCVCVCNPAFVLTSSSSLVCAFFDGAAVLCVCSVLLLAVASFAMVAVKVLFCSCGYNYLVAASAAAVVPGHRP